MGTITVVGRLAEDDWRKTQEQFVRSMAFEEGEVTEADEVAATIPDAWVRWATNRQGAVMCAKHFCTLGATQQEIENLADAIERRWASMVKEEAGKDH